MRLAVTPRLGIGATALELARTRPLQSIVRVGACAYIALFVATAIARATYPYPLDPIESGALQEVNRIRAGQPLYVAPSLEYVPFIYGPVYFYVAALFGPTLAALRTVSILASLTSIALVAHMVRRETHDWTFGLIAAALLASSNPLVDGALDVGRMDALALALSLAAIVLAQAGKPWPSGILIGLAILTKQTALVLALGLAIVFAISHRRCALQFALAAATTTAIVVALLTLQSAGWPLFYLWGLPRQHAISPALFTRFADDLLARFTLPVLVAVAFLLANPKGRAFYAPTVLAMLASSWLARANTGGDHNVDLPAFAILAILFGIGLQHARVSSTYVYGAAVAQLAILIWNPRLMIPYRSDVWAGDRLREGLEELPGPVFAPAYTAYLANAVGPDPGALGELMGAYGGRMTPEGQQWLRDYGAALAERQFASVIVDPDFPAFFLADVASDNGYRNRRPLFPPTDRFWSWRSPRTPRADVLTR